jgi:hypothetical protein
MSVETRCTRNALINVRPSFGLENETPFSLITGARTSGHNLTCVWCRAKWILPASGSGAASGSMTSEGYVNLGSVAGVSPVRDTSSCMNCALALCSMR